MKAVDTNVIARYVVRDDPVQAATAEHVLASACYIPLTVLLELGWLLSSRYRLDRATVAATLTDVIALPSVSVDDEAMTRWAIARYENGADIADMLHIVASRSADVLVTFDAGVAPGAGVDAPIGIETLA